MMFAVPRSPSEYLPPGAKEEEEEKVLISEGLFSGGDDGVGWGNTAAG